MRFTAYLGILIGSVAVVYMVSYHKVIIVPDEPWQSVSTSSPERNELARFVESRDGMALLAYYDCTPDRCGFDGRYYAITEDLQGKHWVLNPENRGHVWDALKWEPEDTPASMPDRQMQIFGAHGRLVFIAARVSDNAPQSSVAVLENVMRKLNSQEPKAKPVRTTAKAQISDSAKGTTWERATIRRSDK